MSRWEAIVLVIIGALAASFVISGVLGRYLAVKRRRPRVQAFLENYIAYAEGDNTRLQWLLDRSVEMQQDAEAVGLGVTYVAPPPMIGGGPFQPHQMFGDLLNRQAYTDNVTQGFRLETLSKVVYELARREKAYKRDLFNPLAWLRRSFERIVGFPRYLLRIAGFSTRVTDSTGARILTVLWAIIVGAATIGSFVVGVIALLQAK